MTTRANKTIAKVPEIILVKYNTAIITAADILTIRSTNPIFFFIITLFLKGYCVNLKISFMLLIYISTAYL